jgi:hypothetical protein
MYVVMYNKTEYQDGTGDISLKIKEYANLSDAEKFVSTLASGTLQNKNIKILTEVGNQIDYKEKFEELYNHLLVQSGIRENGGFTPTIKIKERNDEN